MKRLTIYLGTETVQALERGARSAVTVIEGAPSPRSPEAFEQVIRCVDCQHGKRKRVAVEWQDKHPLADHWRTERRCGFTGLEVRPDGQAFCDRAEAK
jgi:hypothetical protein